MLGTAFVSSVARVGQAEKCVGLVESKLLLLNAVFYMSD